MADPAIRNIQAGRAMPISVPFGDKALLFRGKNIAGMGMCVKGQIRGQVYS